VRGVKKGVHNIAFLGSLHFRKDLTHFSGS